MPQPNDLPLVCLPTDLSDEAAAKLLQFLYELTELLEHSYCAQLRRYYHAQVPQRDLDFDSPTTDPPF